MLKHKKYNSKKDAPLKNTLFPDIAFFNLHGVYTLWFLLAMYLTFPIYTGKNTFFGQYQ